MHSSGVRHLSILADITHVNGEAIDLLEKDVELQTQELIKISNNMQSRHLIVSHPDVGAYPISYLAALLRFFANNTQQYYVHNLQPATLFLQWLDNDLPVMFNPQIEITIEQMFCLISAMIKSDPMRMINDKQAVCIYRLQHQFLTAQATKCQAIGNHSQASPPAGY